MALPSKFLNCGIGQRIFGDIFVRANFCKHCLDNFHIHHLFISAVYLLENMTIKGN
jgi:hypothetical protein